MRRASERCFDYNARGSLLRSDAELSSISSRVSNKLGCVSSTKYRRDIGYIHSLDLIRRRDANLELSLCRFTICLPCRLYCRVVIVQRRPPFIVHGYEWRDEAKVMRHAVIGPERR
jgi:hypothetical protein